MTNLNLDLVAKFVENLPTALWVVDVDYYGVPTISPLGEYRHSKVIGLRVDGQGITLDSVTTFIFDSADAAREFARERLQRALSELSTIYINHVEAARTLGIEIDPERVAEVFASRKEDLSRRVLDLEKQLERARTLYQKVLQEVCDPEAVRVPPDPELEIMVFHGT